MSENPASKGIWAAILAFAILTAGLILVRLPAAAATTPSATASITASPEGTPVTEGAPAEGTKHPAETSSEALVRILQAVRDFMTGIMNAISWPIVIGALAWVFRDSVGKLVAEIINAMRERSVTLDVASVKVQVGERLVSADEDQTTLFSRSPLEIGPEPVPERSAVLGEIPPQLEFQVSDYGAGLWANRNVPAEIDAMRAARDALNDACEKKSDLRPKLERFAASLEAVRFFEAERLSHLMEHHQILRETVEQVRIKAASATDYLILQCAGMAHAQRKEWASGKAALDRIVTKNEPPYLPAADAWLACAYHAYIQQAQTSTPPLELDSAEFFKGVEAIVQQGRDLAAKVAADVFTSFPISKRNPAYYKSALPEVLGDVTSILAEYLTDATKRGEYLQKAEQDLAQCWQISDQRSPLIRNSMADVSRQLGKYDEAHLLLDEAFRDSSVPDPALYHTRAMICWNQGQPLKGLFALEQYEESKVKEDAAQDAEQYLDNQILAAQLAAAVDSGSGNQYVAIAADILEAARQFLDKRAAILDSATAQDLRTRIDELLGFAYLQVPGNESRAVDVFDRLSVAGDKAPPQIVWRRRLGRAKALTRLARSQRRNFSLQVAAPQCDRADAQLTNSTDAVKQFGLDSAVPVARRRRNALLYLDTAVTIQALAEESFCEGKIEQARKLLEQNNEILASLRDALGLDAHLCQELGTQFDTVARRLRLLQAERCFLLGRVAIRSDPSFSDSGLLDRVEASFNAARGVDTDLECRIDLELGELLLSWALAKKGDVKAIYRRSLTTLEAAAGRDVPALRAEALKALADAYSRSPAVARIAQESAKSG